MQKSLTYCEPRKVLSVCATSVNGMWSAVGLIDDLEAAGLAKRERSRDDRRAYVVSLTPKGRKTIVKAIARLSETELQRLVTRLLAQSGPIAEQHRREFQSLLERSSETGSKATRKRTQS